MKLKQVDEKLVQLKNKRRNLRDREKSRRSIVSNSNHSSTGDMEMGRGSTRNHPSIPRYHDDADGDDNSSLSDHSFGGDEDFEDERPLSSETAGSQNNTNPRRSQSSRRNMDSRNAPRQSEIMSRHSINSNQGRESFGASRHSLSYNTAEMANVKYRLGLRQQKLLRKRRVLRENKKLEAVDLKYTFVGTVLNVGIALLAVILIIAMASTGGLCFYADKFPNPFSFQQINNCNLACPTGVGSECDEYCPTDEPNGNQCYFPYI